MPGIDQPPNMTEIYGGGWVMVVEYLESTMSKDLLCKFPDNSAFDFDYSQSSIWSPLVRHGSVSSSSPTTTRRSSVVSFGGLSRKLAYNDEEGMIKIKKFSAKIKRKFTEAILDNLHKYQKMKKRKKRGLDFSPVPSSNKLNSSSSTPRKGWARC